MSPGGPRVGKVVMAAAAKHLTPVTLELGGKNPCHVDDNCDPQTVANRVAFFHYFNSGQTCVAPDYILCSPEMQARLLPALQSATTRFYGEDPQSSPDLGRVISEKNFLRLRRLLSCGRVAIGGQSDESDRYIARPEHPLRCEQSSPSLPGRTAQRVTLLPSRLGPGTSAPTVLVGVQETEPVMREEFFGSILSIMNVRSLDEAIEFIRRREKPLVLYAFSNSSQTTAEWAATTASSPSMPSPTTAPACSPPRAWRSSRTSATRPFLPANSSCSAGPWATSAASFCEHPVHLQCPIPTTPLSCCFPGAQWPPKGWCPVQEHKDPAPGALSEQTPGWAGPLGH
ncbi:aldehyde dehydrogenase family 3 member B2 isoform X1 [Delphinapterus leucas]|uniref:Aldehyde dehydrogenase family 3 member B2 isoform X1 n=1 Tax=Delphinapterus leucas TaxID=9749 RepID=A0A2Y9PJ30_DELLE|nr:aldehyde dehydrogenase family 3 member B2 isoform X1 [Delphinapterus leucas]